MKGALIAGLLLAPLVAGAQRVNPDAKMLDEYRKRVEAFVDLHRRLESMLSPLADQSTPAEIDAHERQLAALMREARSDARPGDIFGDGMDAFVRRIMRRILTGPEGKRLRASIMDENPTGIAVRVNERYPDTVPLSTMPPQLLEEVPKLPEELEYRFVGDNLVILDPHAHLIVDFVTDALPER